MRRQNTIISVGEAMLAEKGTITEPVGIALETALLAKSMGDEGVAISRLGQDNIANELLTTLIAAGLDVSLLQSDPDLPTGRIVIRSIAGTTRSSIQPRAAFDNMQWDFDLIDAAQRADAVVFGVLAQRCAQSHSVVRRLLSECGSALRVFDLTNREDGAFDRRTALTLLDQADVAVIDDDAWRLLRVVGSPAKREDVSAALLRPFDLAMAVHLREGECVLVHTADATFKAAWPYAKPQHAAVLGGLIHGLLGQADLDTCLRLAGIVVEHVRSNPGEDLPSNWANDA